MDERQTDSGRLAPSLVALFAVTTGIAVANIYYAQPLLDVIGEAFGVSDATAGLLVALTQLGYLLGLAFLVPLGDLFERRGLITAMLALAGVAAVVCAAAPAFAVLAGALLVLGVLSVAAQIVVPLASSLAGHEQRGQVVGTVMSGLLIGILSARILSGLIAELAGWRAVFAFAAAAMLLVAAVLRRSMPKAPPPQTHLGYRATLRSVLDLVRAQPVLRQRMAMGLLTFTCFSMLWTALTFLLSGPAYGYSEGVVGLFGIAGVAGASVAPISGRLADRGHARLALTVFLLLILASWGLLAAGHSSVVALILGIVVFDLGVQGAQINNQTTIYALAPEARSRITTAYLASGFCGMVIGSTLASILYGSAGWYAVCAVAAGLTLGALAIWASTQRLGRPAAGERLPVGSSPL